MRDIIEKANKVYIENFSDETHFERALFFSWYCKKGDCKFCYMSTQKDKIKDPKKAKRTKESILAEAIISKNLGWEIEFISGGYESFDFDELVELIKNIFLIIGKKQWINLGVVSEEELIKLKPYLMGFCGAVECVNKKVHDDICPSKPIDEIESMYNLCDKYNLKKAMTLIIGLGESIDDFKELENFVNKHNIDRITFYSLNPQKGTIFTESPDLDYYLEWVAKTRINFPKLEIIAGAWIDKPEYFEKLLFAGANNFTKIPAIKYFGSDEMRIIENSIKGSSRKLTSKLIEIPNIDWNHEVDKLNLDKELKEKIREKLNMYLKGMIKKKD